MTKTKSHLRAEAVERLCDMDISTGNAVKKLAIALDSNWNPDNTVASMGRLRAKLTSLLTDDCETECYACAKLAELRAENNALREIVGDIEVPTDAGEASIASVEAFIEKQTEHESLDTREKLEADCEKLIGKIQERTFSGRDAGALRFQLRELLDRQAAITRAECGKPNWEYCETCELQARVDELERENARLSSDEFYLRCTLVDINGEVVE